MPLLILLFILLSIYISKIPPSTSSQSSRLLWICPNNGSFFDTTPCNPNLPFSCATNFKCRLAVKRRIGIAKGTNISVLPAQQVQYICCESSEMGIREWLLDSDLSPAIFPQIPNSTLWQIVLKDPASGKQVKIQENGADVSMLNDFGFANFSQLAEISFRKEEGPKPKGFLHVLEAINQLAPLSALRLHSDYPSFGVEQLDLFSLNKRFPRGFFQAISSGFVPANDFYRRQQVILVYKTDLPLSNRTTDIERWMGWSNGKFVKLMWENESGMSGILGKPMAGFMFNLTTQGSIFPISSIESNANYSSKIYEESNGEIQTDQTQILANDPGLGSIPLIDSSTLPRPIPSSNNGIRFNNLNFNVQSIIFPIFIWLFIKL